MKACSWQHAQQLPGGVLVLVGPASADEAHAVLRDLAGAFSAWSAVQTDVDIIVDCGRLAPGFPAVGPLLEAGTLMVLTRSTLDQLRPAAHRVMSLRDSGVDASLLLVGDQPYGADEVATTLRTDVVGVVAWDPHAAAVLTGTQGAVRDLRRSPLVRSVRALADRLATPASRPDVGEDLDPAPANPCGGGCTGGRFVSGNGDLRGRLHRTVAEKLSEQLRTLDGSDPLSVEDEHALTRSLIATELEACRRGRLPERSDTTGRLSRIRPGRSRLRSSPRARASPALHQRPEPGQHSRQRL